MPKHKAWWFTVLASSALLLWYKKVTLAIPESERLVFLLAIGAGMAVATLCCEREELSRRAMACAAIGAALCIGLLLVPGWAHGAALVLAGGAVGATFLWLQFRCFRLLPYATRGLAFASYFALSGFVNTLTDIPELPFLRLRGATALIVFASCAALCCALVLLLLKGWMLPPGAAQSADRRLVSVALLSLCGSTLLYTAFGFHDRLAYPVTLSAVSNSDIIRFVEVPIFLVSGWFCDRKGRQIVLSACLVGGLIGSVGALAQGNAVLLVVASAGSYFSVISYAVASNALLADVSHYSKRPAALCALGFLPVLAGQAMQYVLRGIALDAAGLFLANALPCVLLVPVVTALMENVRAHGAKLTYETGVALEPPPSAQSVSTRFGFTKREEQIFELILAELTVKEMSQRLYVTEATVKFHIGNILKKSGVTSRQELLQMVRGK